MAQMHYATGPFFLAVGGHFEEYTRVMVYSGAQMI